MSKPRVHFFPRNDKTYGFPPEAFETSTLPDINHEFYEPEELKAFERALQAPDPLQSPTELQSPIDEIGSPRGLRRPSFIDITRRDSCVDNSIEDDISAVAASAAAAGGELQPPGQGTFITAQNDWAPINSRLYKSSKPGRHRRRRKGGRATVEGLLGTRTKDETREGYLYQLFKWPLLFFVFAWLGGLSIAYLSTRWYIWMYEHFFTWRGQRQTLRSNMRRTFSYEDWVAAARDLDHHLGRQTWREENGFAYYDSKTIKRVWDQMRKARARAETQESKRDVGGDKAVFELRTLIEACVKNNFVGVENARLYSQTYYGTKNLVQNFVDEGEYANSHRLMSRVNLPYV
jgi:hypothetical protein